MRIAVDAEKCQGHARCCAIAPDLFDLDDHGFARPAGTGEVEAEDIDRARRTEMACPERAIRLEGD